MNADRAALVAAILAHPDEDTPRLACADWFEEQGGEANSARAEFIRTQIERANLSSTDPRQSELHARELRLLKKYAAAWTGSHFAFKKCRFRRGFIEYVHLHLTHFLHHRRQLLALEPVRDVSLTGWFRAPTHLFERVAACEEWKCIESLRAPLQGHNKPPGGDLLHLLESPHLTRLRALDVPMVSFDNDDRRRFEQLPLLERIERLHLPVLDTYPHDTEPWFSEGEFTAARWERLRALVFPHGTDLELLQRFVGCPVWGRLESLALGVPYQLPAALELMRPRIPPGLRVFQLSGGTGADVRDDFFARLSKAPLERLALNRVPLSAPALGRMFDEYGQCSLTHLALHGCPFTEDHARAIAGSPKARTLRSLLLDAAVPHDRTAETLFASENLESLTHLILSGHQIGDATLHALAGMRCRLRSLKIFGMRVTEPAVLTLLDSPVCRDLSRFTLTGGAGGGPELRFTAALARRLTALPHLARLHIGAPRVEGRARELIRESDSIAWHLIRDYSGYDSTDWATWVPPLDEAMESEMD